MVSTNVKADVKQIKELVAIYILKKKIYLPKKLKCSVNKYVFLIQFSLVFHPTERQKGCS